MNTDAMTGLSSDRLRHLKETIEGDIAQGRYLGATIIVARHGEIGLHEALGTRRSDDPRSVEKDSVFSLFSLTKGLTNILILRAVELGRLALTTKISDVIPEFSGKPRENIRLEHLLTHRTGLPSLFTPRPGMPVDRLDVIVQAICEHVHGEDEPGGKVAYSPMAAHALIGEMLRRIDPKGRRFRDIVAEDLLQPLAMHSTAVGVRPDLKNRHIVPELPASFPATHPSSNVEGPHAAFEDPEAEMPWVGVVSTAHDIWRFAEMLRRGGELDGARIISPRTVNLATRNMTADLPNEIYKTMALGRGWLPYPAYIGLGFSLRGEQICHHQFGTLATPGSFGNHGAGSTLFWVDPELDMSFVCLTTKLLPEADNIERFQRLSDIAISAAE